MRFLTAVPVYNEADSVIAVLQQLRQFSKHILVVDDGSTDGTPGLLGQYLESGSLANASRVTPAAPPPSRSELPVGLSVMRHATNRGYGAALRSAFCYAIRHGFPWLITMDCDGQHEPQQIPRFVRAMQCGNVDIVSGSRYLDTSDTDHSAPSDRREINRRITQELNDRFGLSLTDAFCGFKAYRVSALRRFSLTEDGYAMPLQLWVQAAQLGLRITELSVPRIYLNPNRTFGGDLDDAKKRLAYYLHVMDHAHQTALSAGRDGPWALARCGETLM